MTLPDRLRDMGYTEEDLDESNPYNVKGTNMDTQELQSLLSGFYGTEQWYRHPLVRECLYTDGVKAFAEAAGAYWLLDILATEVWPLQAQESFLNIIFKVTEDKGVITVDDGNDNEVWSRVIDHTDCPAGEWQFYLTDNVILLPSEY